MLHCKSCQAELLIDGDLDTTSIRWDTDKYLVHCRNCHFPYWLRASELVEGIEPVTSDQAQQDVSQEHRNGQCLARQIDRLVVDNNMTGAQFADLLEKAKISSAEVARILNVDPATIWRWKQYQHRNLPEFAASHIVLGLGRAGLVG